MIYHHRHRLPHPPPGYGLNKCAEETKHAALPTTLEILILRGLILSLDLYVWQFMVGFLLNKLETWQICKGLRSQMASAIITHNQKSAGKTRPV